MVDILSAVLTDGLVAVEAAPTPGRERPGDPENAPLAREALGDGVHSADVILNILVPTPRDQDRVGTAGRQREPGRPLTIATPVALRLGPEPMADCARPPSRTGESLRWVV